MNPCKRFHINKGIIDAPTTTLEVEEVNLVSSEKTSSSFTSSSYSEEVFEPQASTRRHQRVKSLPHEPNHFKKRKVKDRIQIQALKDYYSKERSPNQSEMRKIAKQTCLSFSQVYKWFWEQNRKAGRNQYYEKEKNRFELFCPVLGRKFDEDFLKDDDEDIQMFLCVEIVLPTHDPVSQEALLRIREVGEIKIVFLK